MLSSGKGTKKVPNSEVPLKLLPVPGDSIKSASCPSREFAGHHFVDVVIGEVGVEAPIAGTRPF